jgi:hypothetical protein
MRHNCIERAVRRVKNSDAQPPGSHPQQHLRPAELLLPHRHRRHAAPPGTALWNEHHTTFGAFRAVISSLLDNLDAHRNRLASLITDTFRFIGVSKPEASAA